MVFVLRAASDADLDPDGRGAGGEFVTATFEDATTLTLAAGPPDAVIDPRIERVFETGCRDRAVATDLAGAVDADTGSTGRGDLPGGDLELLCRGIKEKIYT